MLTNKRKLFSLLFLRYLIFILLLPMITNEAEAKHKVCVASVGSDNEEKVMREKLSPDKFEFVDLAANGSDWFNKSCEKNIQCDIVMISAHYAGTFFSETGDRTKNLGLDEMESQACKKSCDGILNASEVFLMGCNTLAPKEYDDGNYVKDMKAYEKRLLKSDFSVDTAERVAMIKHGPLGPSYQKRMRAVFGENSQVYGFSDVAPLGHQVEEYFSKYFDKAAKNAGGDYSQHLEQRMAEKTIAHIEQGQRALGKIENSAWDTEMSIFTNIHCGNLDRDDPNYQLQRQLCFLNDPNMPTDSKVKQSLNLLSKPNTSSDHFPAIAKFFKDHYLSIVNSDSSQHHIEDMKNNLLVERNLDILLHQLKKIDPDNKFPATKVDILMMQHTLGHLKKPSKATLQTEVKKLLKKNGKFIPPTLVNRRLICSLSHTGIMKMEVTADEFDSSLNTPEGILAMNCLKTKDTRITKMAEDLITNQRHEPLQQKFLLQGIANLPGSENNEVFQKLAKENLNSSNSFTKTYANNVLLRSANKNEREQAASTMINMNTTASIAYLQDHLSTGQFGNSKQVAKQVTQILYSPYRLSKLSTNQRKNYVRILAHTAKDSPKQVVSILKSSFTKKQGPITDTLIKQMAKNRLHSPAITDQLLLNVKNKAKNNLEMSATERSIVYYLDGANLSKKQKEEVRSIRVLLNNNYKTYGYAYIRDLLKSINPTKPVQRCNQLGLNGSYCK